MVGQACGGEWFVLRREIELHEEARVEGEASGEEGVVDGAGVVEEEL